MKIFYTDSHSLHAPDWYLADGTVRPVPELPARAERIRAALREFAHAHMPPADLDPFSAIRAVHAADYLEYLSTIHAIWSAEFAEQGARDVLPDTFPRMAGPTRARAPRKPSAQAGYYCFDTAAPITAGTWQVAIESARCAVSAAQEILLAAGPAKSAAAYALVRPPGHHAGADYCGGFCYLNNAAIAAQYLRLAGVPRVAILDIDYHHGNGTQDIFYERSDVLFVSLHAEPDTQFPYFWGHSAERGAGEGDGYTLNLPLPRGTDEVTWLETLHIALDEIRRYGPQALVVSLGVDASEHDPVGDFKLTHQGFAQAGRRIAGLDLPTAIIQEGGYNLDDVGPCVAAFLGSFDSAE